jgi:hypothetical protein
MNLQEQKNNMKNTKSNSIKWVKPDFEVEEGEFTGHFMRWMEDDVLEVNFNSWTEEQFEYLYENIYDAYQKASVKPLTEKEWEIMENTDSWHINTTDELFDIINGMWGRSKERIIKYSIEPIKKGGVVETPIVAYAKGHPPYLVAGNTRLSACRAMGVKPKVTKLKIDFI